MPSRKRGSKRDAEEAVLKSLREFGVQPYQGGQHSEFRKKVVTQVLNHVSNEPKDPIVDAKKPPQDWEESIELLFVTDLKDYLNPKMFKIKCKEACDALDKACWLKRGINLVHISGWAPYYFRSDTPDI